MAKCGRRLRRVTATTPDGSEPIGFLCEPAALSDAEDISAYRSWPAYLELAGV